MSTSHQQLARKVLDALRGSGATSRPFRCFPLKAHHITPISSSNHPPSPNEFHSHLLQLIRNAQHRVHLASLYIGPAASAAATEEHELLHALTDLAAYRPHVEVKLLMDANRALRPVMTTKHDKPTSSAEAVFKCIQARTPSSQFSGKPCLLYLFNPSPRLLVLPSPLNEVDGVFHIKCYIIDDNLILSGANLSQEYFTDRQDRYTWFTNGGGGLVEFYVELVNALCDYSHVYDGVVNSKKKRRDEKDRNDLIQRVSNLMKGASNDCATVFSTMDNNNDDPSVVAYAIPTFQSPSSLMSSSNDVVLTQNLISSAAKEHLILQLASAYLNPTRTLLQELAKLPNRHVQLLTAGPISHGFAPKHGLARKGDWVPQVFSTISKTLMQQQQYDVLWYSRPGWTFHAKGMWITSPNIQHSLVAAMVGSGNYGYRSWHRDVESNVIMVFPQMTSHVQSSLQQEWKSLCHFADIAHFEQAAKNVLITSSSMIKASLPLIQRFF